MEAGLDIKICSTCGVLTDRFGMSSKAKDGLRSQCKDCEKEYNARPEVKRRRYTQRSAETKEDRRLKDRYGISLQDYHDMLLEQNGSCAMCPATALDKKLCVDHNHETGEVRALLCVPCNTMLGMAGDSADRLQAGIDYLKEHGSYESIV